MLLRPDSSSALVMHIKLSTRRLGWIEVSRLMFAIANKQA